MELNQQTHQQQVARILGRQIVAAELSDISVQVENDLSRTLKVDLDGVVSTLSYSYDDPERYDQIRPHQLTIGVEGYADTLFKVEDSSPEQLKDLEPLANALHGLYVELWRDAAVGALQVMQGVSDRAEVHITDVNEGDTGKDGGVTTTLHLLGHKRGRRPFLSTNDLLETVPHVNDATLQEIREFSSRQVENKVLSFQASFHPQDPDEGPYETDIVCRLTPAGGDAPLNLFAETVGTSEKIALYGLQSSQGLSESVAISWDDLQVRSRSLESLTAAADTFLQHHQRFEQGLLYALTDAAQTPLQEIQEGDIIIHLAPQSALQRLGVEIFKVSSIENRLRDQERSIDLVISQEGVPDKTRDSKDGKPYAYEIFHPELPDGRRGWLSMMFTADLMLHPPQIQLKSSRPLLNVVRFRTDFPSTARLDEGQFVFDDTERAAEAGSTKESFEVPGVWVLPEYLQPILDEYYSTIQALSRKDVLSLLSMSR